MFYRTNRLCNEGDDMKIQKFSDLENLSTGKKIMVIALMLLILFSLFYLYNKKTITRFYDNQDNVICEDVYQRGKFITPECPQRHYKPNEEWLYKNGVEWTNT